MGRDGELSILIATLDLQLGTKIEVQSFAAAGCRLRMSLATIIGLVGKFAVAVESCLSSTSLYSLSH